VAAFLLDDEPVVAQPGEVFGGGVFVDGQVGGDAAHVGGGDQPSGVVEVGVECDVFQDRPRHQPDRPFDCP
jgi:hypothetical protein